VKPPGLLALTCLLTLTSAGSWLAPHSEAQTPTAEERLKILTTPEDAKKAARDRARPPMEFFRSQVAPFDILPYVKPNHWSTLNLEMRSNHRDYEGILQTAPVPLWRMPQAMAYRRDARLVKGQRSRLGLQMMLPEIPRELALDLLRPDSLLADESWLATLRVLEPHQMLILVLAKESNDAYAHWARFRAMGPPSEDRAGSEEQERRRYYRIVLPLDPDKPLVSSHPLTWTTISHVIWDGMSPDVLSSPQQQAMLDWLHWGGQLIIVGGAGPSLSALRDSFLAPYLPADPSSENGLLTRDDLKPLADAYPPPSGGLDPDEPLADPSSITEAFEQSGRRYRAAVPIQPASNRPLYVAGLRPRPGATPLPLGESSDRLLGVEGRVGRGRILVLTVNPSDPALAAWPGLDTLVRRVLLRRPEETRTLPVRWSGRSYLPPTYQSLRGPDLSWVRYLSRDVGSSSSPSSRSESPDPGEFGERQATSSELNPVGMSYDESGLPRRRSYHAPVAEWSDESRLPTLSREALEVASGITIPDARFVLRVIVAYMIALVPLNWLVCRYVFGRREWAWVVAPILSLAFAVGVERAAAFDLGYDSACDEIDVIETFGDYPRAHVSRFASLYSTGRVRYTISYPDDPTALALPLSNGRSIGGEDVAVSSWRSYPVPALEGFLVQPRSLALFRAEQMATLTGTIRLEADGGGSRRIVNGTDMELRDAVLVDLNGAEARRETPLGTIAPGARISIDDAGRAKTASEGSSWLDPGTLLKLVGTQAESRPEAEGEIRLVAWTPRALRGQKLAPPVDRHRGLTLVVAHLRQGAPPSPDGPYYNLLARGPERAPTDAEAREEEMRRLPVNAGGEAGSRISRQRGQMNEPIRPPRVKSPPPPVPDRGGGRR